jgi:hypothetical protein
MTDIEIFQISDFRFSDFRFSLRASRRAPDAGEADGRDDEGSRGLHVLATLDHQDAVEDDVPDSECEDQPECDRRPDRSRRRPSH